MVAAASVARALVAAAVVSAEQQQDRYVSLLLWSLVLYPGLAMLRLLSWTLLVPDPA